MHLHTFSLILFLGIKPYHASSNYGIFKDSCSEIGYYSVSSSNDCKEASHQLKDWIYTVGNENSGFQEVNSKYGSPGCYVQGFQKFVWNSHPTGKSFLCDFCKSVCYLKGKKYMSKL